MRPLVSIIILNWNGKEFLENCLNSVFSQTYRNLEVFLVDNGSTDASVDFVKSNYKNVKIISLDKNVGFAEGNNIGIRQALKNANVKYIAVLNNDTEVDKDWISEMIRVAERDGRTGSCACKTIVYHKRDTIETAGIIIYENCSGAGRGSNENISRYENTEEVFGAYGAAALYKREMLEDVRIKKGNEYDYYDSDYFTYQEEFDLSWRALLRGWKCVYAPGAKVYHIRSAVGSKMPNRVKYLLERNRIWTVVKDLQPGLFFYCLPHIIVYEILTVPFYIKKRQFFLVMKARLEAVARIKRFLRKRKTIQRSARIKPEEMKRYFVKRNYFKTG